MPRRPNACPDATQETESSCVMKDDTVHPPHPAVPAFPSLIRTSSLVRALLLVCALAGAPLRGVEFTPPTPDQVRAALGPLDDESSVARRLLTPDESFEPIETPAPGDWLAQHEEAGQTLESFVAQEARRPTATRRFIYVQPLGEFHADSSPSLEALRDYAAAFFQLDVVLLPADVLESAAFEPRINPRSGKYQLRSTAILSWLHERLPDDAFCMVAVTMQDLYPAPSWNFVYGQASPAQRTGVFSFARHDPLFLGRDRPDDFDALMLRRSGRTLVHEIAHLFGLAHCIYYRCVENGVNHQAEGDSRPHHLCPVCLRKLQHATGADLERRYRDLAYFYSNHSGWEEEEAWVRGQLAKLQRPDAVPPKIWRKAPIPQFNSPPYIIPPSPPERTPPEPAAPDAPATHDLPGILPPPAPAPQPSSEAAAPPVPTPTVATEPLVAFRR